ncbi:MAG: hypothetical protein ABI134_09790 [Byssovorax sp.]
MPRSLALAPLVLALLLGCGSGAPKPAEGPEGETPAGTAPPGETGEQASPVEAPPPPPEMGTVKRTAGATETPDDYSLTENDCQALGRQYGEAARADQRVGLNPKLTAKQREQAEAAIDSVVSKLESGWTETCSKSLAGKIVEHKNIKCALAAKTVKSFDVCLNGQKGP